MTALVAVGDRGLFCLVEDQRHEVAATADIHKWPYLVAIRVLVRCGRCPEKVGDVFDTALPDEGSKYYGVPWFEGHPIGAVFTGSVEDEGRIERLTTQWGGQGPRGRYPLDHQYRAMLERESAASLPDQLPVWCSHDGEGWVTRTTLANAVANARTFDRRVQVEAEGGYHSVARRWE